MRNAKATKDRILKKSGMLFNTNGYKATSISQITNATGFTKGAIYRHFTNKDQLEIAALRYLSTHMFETLRIQVQNKLTTGDKLRAVLHYFELYLTDPPLCGGCPLLNAAIEADDAHPMLRREALKILSILRQSIIALLQYGIKRKEIKPGIEKEFYAALIIASLEGAIMMSKLSGNNGDLKKITQHLNEQIAMIEA